MHQTMKKVWAVLLVLCLVLGTIPFGAQAAVLNGSDYITQQLSLGDDLVLHLRASLPAGYEDLAETATGTVTYAGKTDTYKLGDLTPDENGVYDLAVEMAVAEMTETINLRIEGKFMGMDVEAINENYSIRDYLVTIIEGDYSQTTKDLCLELLNMGAWAQLYFNHNISNLANAGYDIQPANPVPDEIPTVQRTGKVDGITFYGTSVRFLSQTAVRFYFEAEGGVDGYTFTIGDATYEPVANEDGLYYIETPGINPQDMSDVITVNVTDGSKTLSVGYAPIWYFIRTYHKTENEYNKALMEASYSYYKEAETFTTQICMDVEITTLSGDFESIGLGFYPLNFEGDINNYTDRIEIPTNTTYTVKLDQGKYLVDGEFLGIGVTVLGGPAWDSKLEDGETPDRHSITISDLRLEGPEDRPVDLTFATIASGTVDTGYTNANAGGTAAVADGVISIANGFFTDGYKITFNEVETYIKLDITANTVSGNYESIGIGFYGYDFEGDINDYVDRIEVPTGETYTVKLDLSKYLASGEFPGIGFAVLGGPAWDTTLEDGTYDRHNITISNIRLEGELDQSIDLSKASLMSGQNGTGYTNANAGGTAAVADGIVTISNGFFTDGYKLTFVDETIPEEPEPTDPEPTEPEPTEPEPPVEEPDTYLCLDMLITTLGNSTDPIEVRFFPYNYTGSVGDSGTDSVNITAGTATTVKLNLDNYLVDGELTGIGFAIMGGPAWDAKLEDGYTPDRHTVTISNARLEGDQSKAFDLSKSEWTSGTNAGYSWANGSGVAEIGSTIVISNGFQYDGHKITLVEDTNTYICLDMLITTLGNSTDPIEVRFFPYNYTGSVGDSGTDSVNITAGTATTVKLNLDNYLVDGELTGIGFAIMGGPAWDAKLEDGYTPDRHTVTISNARLEGYQSKAFDLSKSTWASAANAGYSWANGSGVAEIGSTIVISNGFQYDGHKITLVEDTNTYVTMDMQIDTLGGDWANDIGIRFYPYNFEGNPHETYTDSLIFKAGEKQTVKLNAEKYLVDGELPGIGIGIFGGPEWNTQISDGVYDRHTVTISNVQLTGAQSKVYDLSRSTIASGTADTGYTTANGSGVGAFVDGVYQITNGFCYDCHKLSLSEAGESETPEEQNTYICMDMLFTTGGGSTAPVEIGFYPSNFEGDINDWTDKLTITAGTTANIQLDAQKYMVDGQVSGIGFAIFGGPAWDAKLEDGYTPDRHTVTISNARLEGYQSKAFDLSKSEWTSGTNAGYSWANGSGVAEIGSTIVISNGFQYDGHKITLVEDTNTYIEMDLLLTTLGNSTDPIEVRFCNHGQTDSVHTTYTNNLQVTAGTKTTVRFKVDEYLVNGELPGFGIAIFGGPEWNTQLEDGTYDRHSVVISNLRLTGVGARDIDLSTAAVAVGLPGSNGGGLIAIVDGEIVITGGFRYDGHRITF